MASRERRHLNIRCELTRSENKLPLDTNTSIGVGGFVLTQDNKLLVIKEQYYNKSPWKLPGGMVDHGEEIADAAIREVCTTKALRLICRLGSRRDKHQDGVRVYHRFPPCSQPNFRHIKLIHHLPAETFINRGKSACDRKIIEIDNKRRQRNRRRLLAASRGVFGRHVRNASQPRNSESGDAEHNDYKWKARTERICASTDVAVGQKTHGQRLLLSHEAVDL